MIAAAKVGPEVLIVVPCYNERKRLPATAFARYVEAHPDVGFVFVDDGSTDGTARTLEALCTTASTALRTTSLRRHVGKAEAVRQGILLALSAPDAKYVGFWDADLATPLDALSEFVAVLDTHPTVQLVMGARVRMLGRSVARHRLRHCAGRVFAMLASTMLSVPVYDTQCGAKLFRADASTQRLFEAPFTTRWVFDVEVLARMIQGQRAGDAPPVEDQVYELPLVHWEDVRGSKLKLRDGLVALRDLCAIHHRYLRERLPCVPAATQPSLSRTRSLSQSLLRLKEY